MAKSHQRGTVRLEHHSWVGYMNIKVLDPNTGKSKWKKQRVGVLGPKSKMTKHQAQDSLDVTIAQKTGGTTQPRADEGIATLGWFTRNRFFPLREGSTWKEETAYSRKSAIELDILAKFGDVPMVQIDKFMLQTHLNDLARVLSAGRVMHARFYMKATFEEAIDQDFMMKNPARKLILPTQLRPVDKTTLTWGQLRLVLASVPLRDRILLTLDMTETFPAKRVVRAPLEWLRHGQANAYRLPDRFPGQAAQLGQDQEVAADGAPAGRAGERSVVVEAGVSRSLARCLHLPQFAQAQWGEEERLHPHRQLSGAGAEEASRGARAQEVELPGPAPLDCHAGSDQGEREGRAGHPGTHEGRHHRQCLHAADRGRSEADTGCNLRGVDGAAEAGRSLINLVRFGTVGILGGPQVVDSKGLGA